MNIIGEVVSTVDVGDHTFTYTVVKEPGAKWMANVYLCQGTTTTLFATIPFRDTGAWMSAIRKLRDALDMHVIDRQPRQTTSLAPEYTAHRPGVPTGGKVSP